jgi:hypothetical protein
MKWGLLILLTYMTILLVLGTNFLFIDYFNLVIHEAGHVFLFFLGPTLNLLGGTLFQLFVPLICGIVLIIQQGDWFGGGLCSWWLAENLVNVGCYMADAPYQQLPLLGSGHDWTQLFSFWGLLNQAETIGQFFIYSGLILMSLAIFWLTLQLTTLRQP